MQITFYNVTKKANSTAQPTGGEVITGEFKRGFSLLAPQVEISRPWAAAPTWNYCYIPEFSRYYWCSGWSFYGGLWSCQLSVDVLATYKTQIGAQRLFISRAASAFNGNVVDTHYTTLADRADFRATSELNRPFGEFSEGSNYGMYSFAIAGGGAGGSVNYYLMSLNAAISFLNNLMSTIDWAGISTTEISKELQKALVNPMQYILGCKWLPYSYGRFRQDYSSLTPVYTVKLGYWSISVSEAVMVPFNANVQRTKSLNIPKHPQAATRGSYLNLSPWSTYHLSFFPFGDINLDSTDLSNYSTVECDYYMNLATGGGCLYVSTNGKANSFRICHANFGVEIPVAQILTDFAPTKTNAITAGAALGGALLDKFGAPVAEFVEGAVESAGGLWDKVRGGWSYIKGTVSSAFGGSGYTPPNETAGVFDRIREGIAPAVSAITGKAAEIGSAAASSMLHVEVQGSTGEISDYQFCPIALCAKFLAPSPEDNDHNGRPLLAFRVINTLSGYIECQTADIDIVATADERNMIKQFLLGGFYYE